MKLTIGKEIDYYYIDTADNLAKALLHLQERKEGKIIACDTEVRMLHEEYGEAASWRDPHTSRVSLLQYYIEDDDYPFIVDVLKVGIESSRPLIELLNGPERKVFLNSKFDLKVIRSTWGIWLQNVWCVMLMSQKIGVSTGFRASQLRGHSYRAIARDYFGIDISKVEQTSDWSNPQRSDSQLEYAAMDVGAPKGSTIKSILIEAYRIFEQTLYLSYPYGLGGYCKLKDYVESIELDQKVNQLLAEMEYRGIPLEIQVLDLIYNKAKVEVEELKLYLCKNFNLPLEQRVVIVDGEPQVEVLLSEETQKVLNNPRKLIVMINAYLQKQGMAPLSDVMSGSLEALLKQLKEIEEEEEETNSYLDEVEWGIELIDKLLKYKELVKLLGTDYRKMINVVTGRVHSHFNCIGASTGRMSSGGSKQNPNIQQVSKSEIEVEYNLKLDPFKAGITEDRVIKQSINMRYAFVSDREGMCWASCDMNSQEAKLLAVLSEDPILQETALLELAYMNGEKEPPLHPETGKPYPDPLQDVHIISAGTINAEVQELIDNKPWEANKKNPLVATYRQLGKIFNYCVPLTAQALTREGWRKHNELKIGEDILAYDVNLDRSVWTPLLDLNYFSDAEVYRLHNDRYAFSVVCTGDHRWYGKKDLNASNVRRYRDKATGKRLYSTEKVIPIFRNEWFTTKGMVTAHEIKTVALSNIEGEDDLENEEEMLEMFDEDTFTYLKKDWVKYVLSLSSVGRKKFIELSQIKRKDTTTCTRQRGTLKFYLKKGRLIEGLLLALYLEGYRVKVYYVDTLNVGLKMFDVTTKNRPYVDCKYIKRTEEGIADVWCPTTALGSWIMRQENTITITGNSLMYLAEAATVAKQTGISLEEAKKAVTNYFIKFSGLKLWLESVAATAQELRWIRTVTGDLVFVAENNSHGISSTRSKSVNHMIQAPAATQTKLAIVYADAAFRELDKKYADVLNGRQAELLAPVHR